MIQLYRQYNLYPHEYHSTAKGIVNGNDGKELKMTLAQKKWIIILAIAVVAFLLLAGSQFERS